MKECPKCQEPLPDECFGHNSHNSDGLQHMCKKCKVEYDKKRNFAPQEDPCRLKRCPRCQTEKSATLENFFACRRNADGLTYRCKACKTDMTRQARAANPALFAGYMRKWRSKPENLFVEYARSATRRGHQFCLTFEQFMDLWQKDCSYCGDPIETIGIDRVDSSKDYIPENCVPSCITCNLAKQTLNKEQWFAHMRKVLARADATAS